MCVSCIAYTVYSVPILYTDCLDSVLHTGGRGIFPETFECVRSTCGVIILYYFDDYAFVGKWFNSFTEMANSVVTYMLKINLRNY